MSITITQIFIWKSHYNLACQSGMEHMRAVAYADAQTSMLLSGGR